MAPRRVKSFWRVISLSTFSWRISISWFSAEGYKPLTTHLFVKGAPYINEDAVFGVKESLIQDFKRNLDGKGYTLNYNFVLSEV